MVTDQYEPYFGATARRQLTTEGCHYTHDVQSAEFTAVAQAAAGTWSKLRAYREATKSLLSETIERNH